MGFCLFNNIAIGARYARLHHKLNRVFILDWDVHHGNGTQDIFYEDPSVFFCSLHQFPLYPGTGTRRETGRGAGEGYTLNVPLPPGSGDETYVRFFEDELGATIRRFSPDLIMISAGFDAHRDDPLANMELTTEGFVRLTHIVTGLADEVCGGRIVSVLEGGYDLEALAASAAGHVRALTGTG
jgi:acetoin utilization deacetylase AcuC-like enzyme